MDRPTPGALEAALVARTTHYQAAIDRLRDLAPAHIENDVYECTSALREAVELVRCLRRLVGGLTVTEIHRAFGAPGDFGYETPIGDALSRLYRGGP